MTRSPNIPPVAKPAPTINRYPFWSPLFWHAWRFGDWFRLCARHGFRIQPRRWPMALLITLSTPINSVLVLLQRLIHGRRIAAETIAQPPVFIIGHWRSGTTYLHELLSLDARLATPNTYQCFAPGHFLLTERLMNAIGGWLLPKRRPMDNVAVGWTRPQEDELALLTLGVPSPYERMAFPNDPPPHMDMLDMARCRAEDRAAFEAGLLGFAKVLTLATGKRLLFKSPTHTGRVAVLARLFPGAKFIHLVRDPHALFASTMRLWQTLDAVQGLQLPHGVGLEAYVHDCFIRMHTALEEQRGLIGPRDICDIRYEDLVRDPVATVRKIYDELGLGGFDTMRPRLDAQVAERGDYQRNEHALDDEHRAAIRQRWAAYFDRYGY